MTDHIHLNGSPPSHGPATANCHENGVCHPPPATSDLPAARAHTDTDRAENREDLDPARKESSSPAPSGAPDPLLDPAADYRSRCSRPRWSLLDYFDDDEPGSPTVPGGSPGSPPLRGGAPGATAAARSRITPQASNLESQSSNPPDAPRVVSLHQLEPSTPCATAAQPTETPPPDSPPDSSFIDHHSPFEEFVPDTIVEPGTPENEAILLEEYYRGRCDIFHLARTCHMTIRQVLEWRNRKDTQQLLKELDDFAIQRERDILTQSRPEAAAALRHAATTVATLSTRGEATAHDSRRKAATKLLALAGARPNPCPDPCHRGRRGPTPPKNPAPQPPASTSELPPTATSALHTPDSRSPNLNFPLRSLRVPPVADEIAEPPLVARPREGVEARAHADGAGLVRIVELPDDGGDRVHGGVGRHLDDARGPPVRRPCRRPGRAQARPARARQLQADGDAGAGAKGVIELEAQSAGAHVVRVAVQVVVRPVEQADLNRGVPRGEGESSCAAAVVHVWGS
jgi:hypothetical protein